MDSNQLVRGSLQDISISGRTSLAQAFLGVSALILIDVSYSMNQDDCPGGRKRFTVAQEQLIKLQRDLPGKIGVVAWSSTAYFCPGGLPTEPFGGTNLVNALTFVRPADGCQIKIIIISDGEPDAPDQTLDIARNFKSKLDTIYVGPETGHGRDFLRRLADASGGQSVSQSVREIPQLAESVQRLITTTT